MLYQPDEIDLAETDAILTLINANFGKLQNCDAEAKQNGTLVGRYISHPYADGKAFYQIIAESGRKVTIKSCKGLGDDWVLPAWGEECEISKDTAHLFIAQREAMENLFKGGR